MVKSYLYIAQYYDKYTNREISINDKKIGITNNPKEREKSLNYTKGPIGVMFTHLFECDGKDTALILEQDVFHNLLSDRNTDGEWYKDDDYSLVDSITQTIKGLTKTGFFNIKNIIETKSNFNIQEQKVIEKNKYTYGKLRVTYNNMEFYNNVVVKTYLQVLSAIGIEKCKDVLGDDYISTEQENDFRNSKYVDGFYVETNNSTPHKVKLIEKIKNHYNLDLNIEIAS